MINGRIFKICQGKSEVVSRLLTRETAENHETLVQDSQCPDQESNLELPEYKSKELPLDSSVR
jgi:hypothetical protein